MSYAIFYKQNRNVLQ